MDRQARDRLASTIAAYMRGEIDNFKLDETATGSTTEDEAVPEIGLAVWSTYDDCKRHTVSTTRDGWDFLRRAVAFLRTDLPPAPPPPLFAGSRNWVNVCLGIASLLVIAAAIYLAATRSIYWLLGPGAVVGIPWMIHYCWPRRWGSGDADADRQDWPFYPFRNEAEWRRHEPSLADERLPEFGPREHARPIRNEITARFMLIPGMLLMTAVVAPLMPPLFLVCNALWRRPTFRNRR